VKVNYENSQFHITGDIFHYIVFQLTVILRLRKQFARLFSPDFHSLTMSRAEDIGHIYRRMERSGTEYISLSTFRGVDMIKLDYVTPGSPDNGVNLLNDNSGIVVCYHNAIAQQKRQIRLDISWKLSRDEPYYTIWSTK
jgi:hypothetical protein